jgi:ubiquinone/menaquinone biosynthesis C-methylase UbiE
LILIKGIDSVGFQVFKSNPILRNLFVKYNNPSNRVSVFNSLKTNLKKSDKIINIGCGTCLLDEYLAESGYNVSSIDIYDGALSEKIVPIVYDGEKIPSKSGEYDIALMLSILHHVPNQKKLIKEAKRTAKRIIIQEDIVSGEIFTGMHSVFDNFINLDFSLQKNQYHSIDEWVEIFTKCGLKVKSIDKKKSYLFLEQATFVLE